MGVKSIINQKRNVRRFVGAVSVFAIVFLSPIKNSFVNNGSLNSKDQFYGDLYKARAESYACLAKQGTSLQKKSSICERKRNLMLEVSQQGTDAFISWDSGLDQEVFYFDIQRSFDAIRFEKVDLVAADLKSTVHAYSFLEKDHLLKNIDQIYYRIRQVNLDGQIFYSQVEEIKYLE